MNQMRRYGDETLSFTVESDLLRTALFTILLGGLAALLVYFSICVAAGEGRSIFQLTATLAVFLGCGAAAARRRAWLRFVLVLGSLGAFAFLVDQLVYFRWHERVERLVATLQQDIGHGPLIVHDPLNVPPTSFWIDPGREVLLTFEPPRLAWTYRLDATSPLGHGLIAVWYRMLSRATQGRIIDSVARALVHPHEAYSIGVRSDDGIPACRDGEKGRWSLSIDTRPPDQSPLSSSSAPPSLPAPPSRPSASSPPSPPLSIDTSSAG
jgi:hypothetical protein